MLNKFIKKEGVRLVFNFGPFKLKVRYKSKIDYPIDKTIVYEIYHSTKKNAVLMLEANDFHGEVMPSYIKYLLDLGYSVDLLTTEKHKEDSPLCRIKSEKLNQYYTNISTIEHILQSNVIMEQYKGLFVNSMCLFRKDRAIKSPALIYKFFKGIHRPRNGFYINVCHTIEQFKLKFLKTNNCVILAKGKYDLPIVNPCYFGDVKITDKSDKTIFLISGDGTKNFSLVAKGVKDLIKNGITNFKIYVTGRHKHNELSDDIKSYIEFLGYVSFEKLFKLIEDADFIIPCLDPENKKHLWYLENGTTGAFQLSYGFCKPMILAEKFAGKALVNSTNALIYKSNSDLSNVMKKAIDMPKEEYKTMQCNVSKLQEYLYELSKENLRRIING
jgi:hypothetical protein